MWELDYKESWVPKNWCFWNVVLEKTLASLLDYNEIQPVNPKGNHPEFSLEGLMLKLKLQHFGHLMQRTYFLEKTLMLGKIEGSRRRGQQRMRWLDGITDLLDMSLSKLWSWDGLGSLECCSPWGLKKSDTTERLNWTDLCTYAAGILYSPRSLYYWTAFSVLFWSCCPGAFLFQYFTLPCYSYLHPFLLVLA